MNSVKSIILLELLYKQSSINKEEILNMFMNIVDDTDTYKRLENLLNSNIFIGSEAADLHKRSNVLLNEVRVNPREAINIFFKLEELVLIIENKKRESEEVLSGLDFFCTKPTVVSKTLAASYSKFYEEFYKVLTYLSVILFGPDGINKWTAFPMGSFADMVDFVDDFLSQKMSEIKATKKRWSVVEKYYSGGRAGISYNGCELLTEETEGLVKIGTYKHPYLKMGNSNDKKMVEGYGYITGVDVNSVDSLFEGELIGDKNVANLQIDSLTLDSNMLYNPIEFLSKILGTRKFIFSPEAYVMLLNKYFRSHTIIERKNSSKCLLCGRRIDASQNNICSNHFDYTQN